MGFSANSYAKIWELNNKGKYSVVKVTVSKKDKETNKYNVDFEDGFVRLIGHAHETCKDIVIPQNGLSVQIKSCDVQNRYDPKTKTKYVNYVIYDLELQDANSKEKKAEKPSKAVVDDDDEDLPFNV